MVGPNPQIRAMTWNLRYDNPDDGIHSWVHRRQAVAQVWAALSPDLVFLQEALVRQYLDLQIDQPGYRFLGEGREGGGAGEFVPLAYRASRFTLVTSGVFWLSETPDVPGSVGWDAACPRVVTWARLVDRTTGWVFVAASVHLDHQGAVARSWGTQTLVDRLGSLARGAALVIAGDLNAEPGDEPHRVLRSAGLEDLVATGAEGWAPGAFTYHGFDSDPPELIDFVYGSRGWGTLGGGPVDLRPSGVVPSDHLPVVVTLDVRGWVVFDMDGTLYKTESSTLPACRRALSALGLPCPSAETLLSWIGEPSEVFCRRLAPGLSDADFDLLTRQIDLFELEAVRTVGELYPGVPETLAQLKARGYRLAVCSLGSPEYLATITERTGIGPWFDLVVGAGPDVRDKAQLLASLVPTLGPRAVLVGDRSHDVAAALAHGLPSIGALWGYGPTEARRATVSATSVLEVADLVDDLLASTRGPR